MSLAAGAFARTCRRLGPKKDAPVAMEKWWKKVYPTNGEITQHLAANEQQIIVPWIKTFPKKMVQRVPVYLWPFGSIVLVYVTIQVTEAADRAEDYAHRF